MKKDYTQSEIESIKESCFYESPLDLSIKENHTYWAQQLNGTLFSNGTIRIFDAKSKISELKGYEESKLVKLDILINKEEVDALMALLVKTIEAETPTLAKNNVRLLTIGDTSRMPNETAQRLQQCIDQTAQNTGLSLVLALSYSSRWEITNAIKNMVKDGINQELNINDINEETISNYLSTRNMPDPELLIRTSGEYRISNFLLWQIAYTELYFTEVLWPDFKKEDLYKAIVDFQSRERRFGKTSEQVTP